MKTTRRCLVLLAVYAIAAGLAQAADEAKPLYRDATQPIEKRVADLLGRMTLEEKVGQMNMPCVYVGQLGRTITEKTEGVQKFAAGSFLKGIGPGGGFFTLPNNILLEGTGSKRSSSTGSSESPWNKRGWAFPCWKPRKARMA